MKKRKSGAKFRKLNLGKQKIISFEEDTWRVCDEIHSWRPTHFDSSFQFSQIRLHHMHPRAKSTEFVRSKKKVKIKQES